MSTNDPTRMGGSTGAGDGFGARATGSDKLDNMLDGRDDPNRGPLDCAANALSGHDDPNRGPLDRTANALTGGGFATGGVASGAGATASGGQASVSAVFDSHVEAERAVSELRSAGISDNALSIIAQHGGTTTTTSGDGSITDESHRNVIRGILGGGALGAGLGIAALAIPGVGPLAAAGAIAASAVPEAAALGALVGATAGTLNEVLTKHGVSEEDASYYSDRMKSGGVFVSVDTSQAGVSAETARDILYRNGGHSSSRAKTS